MTESPHSPQSPPQGWQQPAQPPVVPPLAGQPMNIYPAPGAYGAAYPGQQAKAPAWPMVVGIISLCVAGIFGLMTIGPLIYQASGFQTAQQRQMMENMPGWFGPYQWFAGTFVILTYTILAVGGVMLLKRRRAARNLHFAYATMGIIGALAGLVVMIMTVDYMTLPSNGPPQAQAMMKPMMTPLMVFSAVFGMLFVLAYPTFLLIWFGRAKVKQHIQTWQS